MSEEEKAEVETKKKVSSAKAFLRNLADSKGQQYVISAITNPGLFYEEAELKDIEKNFKVALLTDDLTKFHYEELFSCLMPETTLERISYRRNIGNAIGGKRNFVVMKG